MTTTDRFQPHLQTRKPFIFAQQDQGNRADAAKKDPAERQARAAEYIAMYLDRIETHLDRIAAALWTGGVNEKLRAELLTIAKAIQSRR